MSDVKTMLFLRSQNRLRSPTAEQVFDGWPNVEVASAGLNHDADTPATAELVERAEIIFVSERAHRNKLQKRFRTSVRGRVTRLDIPDEYEFMDATLVALLRRLVPRHLP